MDVEPATNTTQSASRGRRNSLAVGYMLVSVLAFSNAPLLVNWVGGSEYPFYFGALYRAGVAIGCLLFLLMSYPSNNFYRNNRHLINKRIFSKLTIFATIGALDYTFFAWSVKFIDITATAVMYEVWPVSVIFFTSWLYRRERRFSKVNLKTTLLLGLIFVGFLFTVSSQHGSLIKLDSVFILNSLLGLLFVIAAITASTLNVCGLKWASDLSEEFDEEQKSSAELTGVVISLMVTSSASVVVNTGLGVTFNELPSAWMVLSIVVGGIFTYFVGGIAWRKAVFTGDNLGINAMAYLTPVLSVILLFVFSQTDVARWDYLIIGAAAIITANLLINFEAEVRSGFKALLLALGICGAVVYLRDGVFELLGIVKWNWTGSGYFESITLAATVFTLLLAFRVARLVSRTSEEDNRTFIVYRKLDLLARRGIIDPQVCDYILQIDKANNDVSTEREAYTKARRLIAAVDPAPLNEADSQLLSDAEANLDALARSKQVDIHLGEQFALGIFGAITIGLALLTLPPQVEEGWPRLMVDLFAMLISAVIIFLLFHIQDLQRERDDQKLDQSETRPEYRHYLVRFLDIQRRSFDKWLSITVGAAIVVIYTGLLANKWLGWLGWLG